MLTVRVAALTRYPQKSGPNEVLQEATLAAGLGMEGNFRQGGERQICLLASELREWIDSQTEQGICFRRFKENLLLAGIPDGIFPPGARLQIGDVVLRMSEELKRCHNECELASRGKPCRLSGSAVFAAVECGGVVRIGDCVCVRE